VWWNRNSGQYPPLLVLRGTSQGCGFAIVHTCAAVKPYTVVEGVQTRVVTDVELPPVAVHQRLRHVIDDGCWQWWCQPLYGAPSGHLLADFEALGRLSSMPISIIWGVEDSICPIEGTGEALVRKTILHAKLMVMPNAGHAVLYEEAEVFEKEIAALLAMEPL
jgi:pimeloyl-ACP methyl ester carboxylesterase